MKFLLTGLVIVLFSVDAGAGGCRTVYRSNYIAPYVAPIVKKAVKVYDVHDYYPVYNRSYLESYDNSYKKERIQQQQFNIEMLKTLNLLQQQIQRGYQSPQYDPSKRAEQIPSPKQQSIPYPPMPPAEGFPQQQPQAEHPAIEYFRSRCIRCHGNGKSDGGLTMFDSNGQFFNPTCKQAVEILKQMKLNKMPKNGPKPTDQEYSQVVDWLTTLDMKGRE